MRFRNLSLVLVTAAPLLFSQSPEFTSISVGLQMVLIRPGSMQVGVYQPTCPDPNGRGGGRGAFGPGPNGGGGRGEGRGGGPRPPQDPRTAWTPEDYAKCAELVKRDTMPGFKVEMKKPYYIGKYEVTQGEWKKVMGNNPSYFQGDKVADDADKHPVDSVTWADARAFVKKLNALEKAKLYRLPTEFEWEYAGRAGGAGQVPWNDIRAQAWEQGGTSNKAATHLVGTKVPNAWGLYDMLGNVWEWVDDYYNYKIFPEPTPPKSGTLHVLKGGGFLADVKNVIYATHGAGPGSVYDVGFRVVRDLK
jgi:formylglycine-generating enzyme